MKDGSCAADPWVSERGSGCSASTAILSKDGNVVASSGPTAAAAALAVASEFDSCGVRGSPHLLVRWYGGVAALKLAEGYSATA